MGIIRETGTRQAHHTAHDWSPYRSELRVTAESVWSPPESLSNPNKSEFSALCRADS